MAAFNYHKGNDQIVVQQLNELFGDKLNLDIIKNVAKSCQFDVHQSSNELLEIADTEHFQYTNKSNYMIANASPASTSTKKSKKALEIEKTIEQINEGYKVIVLLRGLPGSGKSTLAKQILQNTIGYNDDTARKHILSADDFFMKNGVYQYNINFINEAHGWNHQRAFNMMSKGYSPVIIDNTNLQMWEMKPYAVMATDYGYILQILEPNTHWCFNERELEKRNIHGVPKSKIISMLERYEKNVTPMKLLTAYDCKYKLQKIPQFRLHPPVEQVRADPVSTSTNNPFSGLMKPKTDTTSKYEKFPQPFLYSNNENSKETTNFMDFCESSFSRTVENNKKVPDAYNSKSAQSTSVDDILMQSDASFLKAPVLKPMHATEIKHSSSLFDNLNMNAWGVDAEALRSWDIVTPLKETEVDQLAASTVIIDDSEEEVIETNDMSTSTDDYDFYILRNLKIPPPDTYKVLTTCNRDINRNIPVCPQINRKKLMIDKSCLTEDVLDDHTVHLENLARVFPNVPQNIIKYWYQKCNCDFDCTMELLLAEKEEIINVIIDDEDDALDKEEDNAEPITIDSDSASSTSDTPVTPQNTKNKRKTNNSSSDESQDLKKYIESKINISDDHYSEKLLRIKQLRYGHTSSVSPSAPEPESSPVEMDVDENKCIYCDDTADSEIPSPKEEVADDNNLDTIELNLGDHFVKQLEDHFGDPGLLYPKGFQPVVQVPVALARQLYTFYIESVYQQMEAQNTVMEALMKEDEAFARKLQESEDDESSDENNTQPEPTEIPDIMREQRELSKWQKEADKWKEDTPDTLALRLTKNKLFDSFPRLDKDTLVEILHAHDNVYKETVETLLASTSPNNINGDVEAIRKPPINKEVVKEMWEEHESCRTDEEQDAACSARNYREEANRYLEKRTRLYEKAQMYYLRGMKEVAQFYSSLASKQTILYEHANSLAATAFLDEHSKRLEDFNMLDLHFLYVKEAIPHLDIFLDRNINLLRLSTTKSKECLQIITGRGRHSKNGVPKIKSAVIARLKERKLSFQQLNAGMLKLKITKNSRMTSEL